MSAILGNGTVTFGDGSVQSTAAQPHGMQAFTSSGTFTIPNNVKNIKVIVVGAGGGSTSLGGGGGGGLAISWLSGLNPGSTLNITVGSGSTGNGGTSQVYSGSQSITTITAYGGNGGNGDSTGSPGGAAGGSYNFNGQKAQGRIFGGSGTYHAGQGAPASYFNYGAGGGAWVNSTSTQGIVVFEW